MYYILTDESIKVTIKKQLFKGNIAVSRNTTGHGKNIYGSDKIMTSLMKFCFVFFFQGGETFSMEDNEIEDEGCTACNDTAV